MEDLDIARNPVAELATELEKALARIDELEARQAHDQFLLAIAKRHLEMTEDAIFYTDPELRIKRANPAFHRLTRLGPEEVVNAGLDSVFRGAEGQKLLRLLVPRLRAAGCWQGETARACEDGSARQESLAFSAVAGASGETIAYIGVIRDLSSLRSAEKRLEYSSRHDALTGLPNREAFLAGLGERAARAAAEGGSIAACALDHADFQRVNNDLSREAGDGLLVAVARRLSEAIRSVDLLARTGGDEFSLAMELKAGTELRDLAARVLGLFDAPFEVAGRLIYVSATMGVAVAPEHGVDPTALVARADLALQSRKAGAKSSFSLYRPEMDERLQGKASLASELRSALASCVEAKAGAGGAGGAAAGKRCGRFYVNYQPIVDIASGRLACVEALSRWEHPKFGQIPPGRFIPLAEESGLIVELGRLVLRAASAQAGAWLGGSGDRAPIVGVNVSARQLLEPGYVQEVRDAIAKAALPRDFFVLEITESQIFEDLDAAARILGELKDAGAQICVDDFGTGYSSLSYLKRLPIDTVKIDRSFVCDIDRDRHDRRIVETVAALTRELGAKTVAEGVETTSQLEILRSIGCDYAQGFLFGRAQEAGELEGAIARGYARTGGLLGE
ncbi:MAG: EAL domain-containing protein [Spirochaetaceae bacterium]|nr:EAL domain-containing protein [Spirochaetaceae bacterium]